MGKNIATVDNDSIDLYISQEEYQIIRREFGDLVQKFTPGLYPQSQELLDRISTPNWALEWGLPRWLGEAYDLPESTTHDLILANVLLLGFVRIMDDVIDDDFQPSCIGIEWISTQNHQPNLSANKNQKETILLGTFLHNLWFTHQLRLLSRTEATATSQLSDRGLIPDYLDAATLSLSQWINATSNQERRPAHGFSDFSEADYLIMGHRFSLLKTCCTTACLIAGRETEIQPLTTAIDHILVGVVMMDDIFDWLSDLQNGRYNVFIAFCSDLEQIAELRKENELAILHAIYVDRRMDSFFDLILEHISRAEEEAMLATSPKFSKFICCLRSDLNSHKEALNAITLAQMKESSDRFLNGSLLKP